ALNWHGQPYEQLQLTNSVALISQGVMADLPSALGFTFYDTIRRCDAAATVIFVAAIQSRRYTGDRSGTSDLCLPTHVYADRSASIPTTIAYRQCKRSRPRSERLERSLYTRPAFYRSTSIPLRLTTCSSFSAAPVGLRSPRSHWLTVFTATLRKPANTAWLTPARSRTRAISAGERSATFGSAS